jgi:hypothetical protein
VRAYALEFYNFMKNLDFSDSILRLPKGMTFPVEIGKSHAGILIKRPVYEKLQNMISLYDNNVDLYQGVILIGPPGAGKVYSTINYFLLSYMLIFVK